MFDFFLLRRSEGLLNEDLRLFLRNIPWIHIWFLWQVACIWQWMIWRFPRGVVSRSVLRNRWIDSFLMDFDKSIWDRYRLNHDWCLVWMKDYYSEKRREDILTQVMKPLLSDPWVPTLFSMLNLLARPSKNYIFALE